jgi:hypothetical protein
MTVNHDGAEPRSRRRHNDLWLRVSRLADPGGGSWPGAAATRALDR